MLTAEATDMDQHPVSWSPSPPVSFLYRVFFFFFFKQSKDSLEYDFGHYKSDCLGGSVHSGDYALAPRVPVKVWAHRKCTQRGDRDTYLFCLEFHHLQRSLSKYYLHLLRWVHKKCFDDKTAQPSEIYFKNTYLRR